MKLSIAEKACELSTSLSYSDDDVTELPRASSIQAIENLSRSRRPKIGLLPPALRWLSEDMYTAVFERPPMYQRLELYALKRDSIRDRSKTYTHILPIPWTVYVVQFNQDYVPIEIRVFARNDQLNSTSDFISILPIPNLYFNGQLCKPAMAKVEDYEPTLTNGIQAAYNMVWNSGFNMDLHDAVRLGADYRAPVEGSAPRGYWSYFSRWSEQTMTNVLATDWPIPFLDSSAGKTFGFNNHTLATLLDHLQTESRVLPVANGTSLMVHLANTIMSSAI